MFPQERAAMLAANPWVPPWIETFVRATGFRGPGAKGWARPGRIVIAPAACTAAGRGYSWPGSVSDCTVRGVYLHEIGHLAHAALAEREKDVLAELWSIKGPPVTGYEPNPQERFAETFRLFFGNPGLLLAGRPRRYEVLLNAGVRHAAPLAPWDRGLLGAPPQRFLDQCERWIARGHPATAQDFFAHAP